MIELKIRLKRTRHNDDGTAQPTSKCAATWGLALRVSPRLPKANDSAAAVSGFEPVPHSTDRAGIQTGRACFYRQRGLDRQSGKCDPARPEMQRRSRCQTPRARLA